MSYIFSQQDLREAWRRFESFVDAEVYPRLIAQKVGAEMLGKDPTVLEISTLKLVALSRTHPMLLAGLLVGSTVKSLVSRGNQPAGVSNIPVILRGMQAQNVVSSIAMRHGAGEYLSAYQTMLEAVSPDDPPFSLYASNKLNAYLFPHRAEDMPNIVVHSSMLSDRPALVAEIARQTAPVYQFAYLHRVQKDTGALNWVSASAALAGLGPDEFERIAKAYLDYEHRQPGNYHVATAAHEFAHATIQPIPRIGEKTLRDYAAGANKLEDLIARYAFTVQWHDEGQADIFSMGVSLDPTSVVRKRYYGGLIDAIASAAPDAMRGFRLGDALRLRVIDPKSVESPDSPLYQLVHRYSTTFAQRLTTQSPAAGTSASVWTTLAVSLSRAGIVTSSGEFNQHAAAGFLRAQQHLSRVIAQSIVNDYRKGQLSGLDPDVEHLVRFQQSRFWSIGYAVGKSRPDLIGQELEVSPQGVRVVSTGEEIDLGRIGLPELQITAPSEAPELHPVQLERGFSALAVYNKAREALRAGLRLDVAPGASAADVVQSWRTVFWKVMSE